MSYLLHLLSACVLPDVLGVSNLSGMTGMTDWLHLLFRLFLLLGNTEIFDGFHCLSPLLVTLLCPLFPLLGVTLLIGVTIGLGRCDGKLGLPGVGGHILFISANLLGPMYSRCTSHKLPISSCVRVNWSHKVVQQ